MVNKHSIGKLYFNNVVNLYTRDEAGSNAIIQHYQVHTYPAPMPIEKDQKLYRVGNRLRTTGGLINVIRELKDR